MIGIYNPFSEILKCGTYGHFRSNEIHTSPLQDLSEPLPSPGALWIFRRQLQSADFPTWAWPLNFQFFKQLMDLIFHKIHTEKHLSEKIYRLCVLLSIICEYVLHSSFYNYFKWQRAQGCKVWQDLGMRMSYVYYER